MLADAPELAAPVAAGAAALVRGDGVIERRLRRRALLVVQLQRFGDLRHATATRTTAGAARPGRGVWTAARLRLRFAVARALSAAFAPHECLALRHQFRIGRPETQRRIRHAQHILALLQNDVGVRRHAGQQLPAGIVRLNHHRVAHDAALGDALLAHLAHAALELPVRERIDRELHRLPFVDFTNIGFIHRDVRLQPRQILRDHKQSRRLQARRHRLADVHLTIHDNAIDRRANDAAIQIRARGRHLCRRRSHRRPRRIARRALLRHQLFGRKAALLQQRVTLIVRLRDGQLRLLLCELRLGLHDALLKRRRIEPRQHLPGAHLRIEIHQHCLHRPRYRRADIRRHQRLQRTRCAHHARDRAAIHFRRAIGLGVVFRAEKHEARGHHGCRPATDPETAATQEPRALGPDPGRCALHAFLHSRQFHLISSHGGMAPWGKSPRPPHIPVN